MNWTRTAHDRRKIANGHRPCVGYERPRCATAASTNKSFSRYAADRRDNQCSRRSGLADGYLSPCTGPCTVILRRYAAAGIFVSTSLAFASYSFVEVPESLKVYQFVADVNDKDRLGVESFEPLDRRRVAFFGVAIVDIKKIALLGGVGAVSAAVGIMVPPMLSGGSTATATANSHDAPATHEDKAAHGHDDKSAHGAKSGHEAKPAPDPHAAKKDAPKADPHGGGHGAAAHGGHGGKDAPAPPKVGPVFIPFGQLIVNLNVPNQVRYLSIDLTVETDAKFETDVKEAIESQKPRLKTWLISNLADKSVEDIQGRVGVNRMLREIQDNFNSLIFKDGHERIQAVHLEEFHVQ